MTKTEGSNRKSYGKLNKNQGSKHKPNGRNNKHGAKSRTNGRNSNQSSLYKRPRHEKLEIKFDPTARREYLTGLSARKKEKRAFGLAMQKVKDRKAKMEERKETKQAILEQIEEAEKSKELMIQVEHPVFARPLEECIDEPEVEKVKTFKDKSIQSQFGGDVIVTTTFYSSGNEDDSDVEKEDSEVKTNVDMEQQYCGSVQKYMAQMKGHLPAKKNKWDITKGGGSAKRGKHGAANMKGMGSGKDFNLAKKTLKRMEDKGQSAALTKGRKGKKRR